METLQVIEEESEWIEDYKGPIAYCGKGGGGGAQPDYAYNKTMASIAEANQAMAEEMWNIYKYGTSYNPTEEVYLDEKGNPVSMTSGEKRNTTQNDQGQWVHPDKGVLQKVTKGEQEGYDPTATASELDLMQQMLDAQSDLLPYEKELLQKTIQTETGLVGERGDLESTLIGAKRRLTPFEEDLARTKLVSETGLIGDRERLERTQLETESGLVPERGALESERIGVERGLLPYEERLRRTTMDEGEKLVRGRGGMMQSLYKDALTGVDVEGRVSEHRAGVQHAFKGAQGESIRNMQRYGIDPSSGRGLATSRDVGLAKARALAGGEHQIRSKAEDENFKRKTTAAGLPI
jgi:hypothetical protein